MASTNQSPFYKRAEEDFLKATTDEEKIQCLEIMIKECPKHKSSENMLKNLTTRLKKFKDKSEKSKKGKKGQHQTFKKAPCQIVLFGKPNTGKSTFFNLLTEYKIQSKTTCNPFTTKKIILGDYIYETANIQIIDQPSIPYHDKSIVNTTDILLIFVNSLEEIKETENKVWKSSAKKIYLFNKIDLLKNNEL
jgi:ribosome-interacting GTPase 1